jgi:hypothetical protein
MHLKRILIGVSQFTVRMPAIRASPIPYPAAVSTLSKKSSVWLSHILGYGTKVQDTFHQKTRRHGSKATRTITNTTAIINWQRQSKLPSSDSEAGTTGCGTTYMTYSTMYRIGDTDQWNALAMQDRWQRAMYSNKDWPLHKALRKDIWPNGVDLQDQLYGDGADMQTKWQRTAEYIWRAGLTV